MEFHGALRGVYHFIFCVARVNAPAADGNDGPGRVEVFIFQISYGPAVHRISKIGAEAFYVKLLCAAPDFFVWGKCHGDCSVRNAAPVQFLRRRQNFCNACLVVRTEQGGSVGYDQIAADAGCKIRRIFGPQNDFLFLVEDESAAVVRFDDPRLYPGARCVLGGIHMGNQTDHRRLHAAAGGKHPVNIAAFILAHLCKAELFHLFRQRIRQYKLARRAGAACAVLMRCGVE